MSDKRLHSDSELGGGDSDDTLRRRFAVLRREEEQQAPEFDRLWKARPGDRSRQTRWYAAAACALIAVLAFVLIRSAQHRPGERAVASITEWKAPTDFLLETPGRELLSTVPEIGRWQVYAAMPGATPTPVGKKVLQ
jgi:hypothetical protein